MDPKHSAHVLKHLEKQKELCKNAHDSMSHDLHTLKVEEEMLMRKFKEFMEAHGFVWEVDKDILMRKFREYVEDQNSHVKKYTDNDQTRAFNEAATDDEDVQGAATDDEYDVQEGAATTDDQDDDQEGTTS